MGIFMFVLSSLKPFFLLNIISELNEDVDLRPTNGYHLTKEVRRIATRLHRRYIGYACC